MSAPHEASETPADTWLDTAARWLWWLGIPVAWVVFLAALVVPRVT